MSRTLAVSIALLGCVACNAPSETASRGSGSAANVAAGNVVAENVAVRIEHHAQAEPVDPSMRQRWREAALEKGSVPAGKSAAEWARELTPWLASTDPELRDDLAYTVLAGWIVRGKIEDAPLRELAAGWRAQLARPGTTDADILARSFAALTLAAVVAWDMRQPFLGDAELARLRAAGLQYAATEHDVRGYDDALGWVHATAHTADFLKFLAREPALPLTEQAAFLAAIDAKAALPGAAWTAGEDLRLARIASSLLARTDLDATVFTAWIDRYEREYAALWQSPRVDGQRLAAAGNLRRVLAELAVLLAIDLEDERQILVRDRILRALTATG